MDPRTRRADDDCWQKTPARTRRRLLDNVIDVPFMATRETSLADAQTLASSADTIDGSGTPAEKPVSLGSTGHCASSVYDAIDTDPKAQP